MDKGLITQLQILKLSNIKPNFSELARLQSLPSEKVLESYLTHDRQTTVRKDSMVTYMKNKYSVPADYIGKPVRLKVSNESLQIYYSTDLIATHSLSDKRLNYKKEHYTQLLSGYIKNDDDRL